MGSTTSFKPSKVPDAKGVVILRGVNCIVTTNDLIAVCCKPLESAVYSFRNEDGREYTKNQVRVNWSELRENYRVIREVHALTDQAAEDCTLMSMMIELCNDVTARKEERDFNLVCLKPFASFDQTVIEITEWVQSKVFEQEKLSVIY